MPQPLCLRGWFYRATLCLGKRFDIQLGKSYLRGFARQHGGATCSRLGRWTDSRLLNQNPLTTKPLPPEIRVSKRGLLTTGLIVQLWSLTHVFLYGLRPPMHQMCSSPWWSRQKDLKLWPNLPKSIFFLRVFPQQHATEGHGEILKYGSGHFGHFPWRAD